MNRRKIKAKMIIRGYNADAIVDALSAQGIDISKNTWYRKMRGDNVFTLDEVAGLVEVLELSDDEIIDIFFEGRR